MNLFTGIMIPFIGTTLVFAVTLHDIPEGGEAFPCCLSVLG